MSSDNVNPRKNDLCWGCAKPHWHIIKLIFTIKPHSPSDSWNELSTKPKYLRALMSITKLSSMPKGVDSTIQLLMHFELLNLVLQQKQTESPVCLITESQTCRCLEKPPQLLAAVWGQLWCAGASPQREEKRKHRRAEELLLAGIRHCLQQLLLQPPR